MENYKNPDFLDRLIPVSEARRKFGVIIDSLPKREFIILTKSGKPVAGLIDLAVARRERSKNKLLSYCGMFKTNAYWNKDWGKTLDKWRKKGSRKAIIYAKL